MLKTLTTKTLQTTNGILAAAANLGVSPLDPEAFALAMGGLVIKRVRDYMRGGPA